MASSNPHGSAMWPSREPGPRRSAPGAKRTASRLPVHLADPQLGLLALMRTLSLVSLFTAAWNWAAFLGLLGGPEPGTGLVSLSGRVPTLYFAVLDPIAAVGLWMASSWGGVVWLLSATSRLVLAMGLTEQAPLSPWVVAYQVSAIGLYLYLSRRAALAVDD
jgi:Family of unknown function (DUF6163)